MRGGAAAISVLTEPSRFDGSLEHLEEVVAAVPGTPVMRKDFLVDPVQILEARRAGASGVLLITTLLDDRQHAQSANTACRSRAAYATGRRASEGVLRCREWSARTS